MKNILVPLDGSQMAQSVLPMAAYLAGHFHSKVILIHVIEKNAPASVHGESHLRNPEEAHEYLNGLARSHFDADISVEAHVHLEETDNVARSIVEHVAEFDSDIIILCTHGQPTVSSKIFGSIAQKVITAGKAPVLIIPSGRSGEAEFSGIKKIMVPLDGNPQHESGAAMAATLGPVLQANINLVLAIPTLETLGDGLAAPTRFLPRASYAMLEMTEPAAEEYLEKQIEMFESRGLKAESGIYRGDPAEVILEAAQAWPADLIIMGTHGTSKAEAFWEGSLTPTICRRCNIPVLLAPVS